VRLAQLLGSRARAGEAQLAHALRTVPLFRDLPAAELVTLWRELREERVPAGTVVCARGDPGDRCYIVQRGACEVRLPARPDGTAGVSLRRVGPGDCFGEMALVTGAPRTADVVAAEDAVLWVLDRTPFEALTGRSVPLLRALNRDLCGRLALLTLQVEAIQERLGVSEGGGVAGLRFGAYRAVEQIGSGGMAVVFSAVHGENGQAVALKVLPAAWGEAAEFRARLEREGAVLHGIEHPNVVRVLDAGAVRAAAGGGYWLAMEWLPHALDRVLRARYPDPVPPDEALRLALGVAEGLAAAHRRGIVHRDVKPSNVLLRADGTPVLTDFGLATARATAAGVARLTTEGVVVGTADYMAPEQVAGLPIDGRADVYALGAVLYELLAGHPPFAGRDPLATLRAHVEEPPPPLAPALPARARAIVERALQKFPDDRFPSAAALAEAIGAARAAPSGAGGRNDGGEGRSEIAHG
jgi:CRP-like cAMP-binding protein